MCEGDKSHVVNGAMSYHGNVSLPRAVRLFLFFFLFSFSKGELFIWEVGIHLYNSN